jgi:hypothetical protein
VRELFTGETMAAAEALLCLREDAGPAERLVARIDELQRPEGYRLVASFDETGQAVAAGGSGWVTTSPGAVLSTSTTSLRCQRPAGVATPLPCCDGYSTRPFASTVSRSISTRVPSATQPIASICVWACTSAPTTSASTHPRPPGPNSHLGGRGEAMEYVGDTERVRVGVVLELGSVFLLPPPGN